MIERIDPLPYHKARFFQDLQIASQAIDSPFSAASVEKSLDIFDEEFQQCVVQMKATTKHGEGLYYRFFYKYDKDLTAVAQKHGLIPAGNDPLIQLQYDVLNNCPGATRAGLDFDTSFGLAKVWTFTGGPTPLDKIAALTTMPKAIATHIPFFLHHGLQHVFFVASDHQQNSMNIYFGLEAECRNEQWLKQLIAETGGAPDDINQYSQMIRSLAVSAGVGMTFRWDSPNLDRWCLYGLNLPCLDPVASLELPLLPPRLQAFRDSAPTLNQQPQFNAAWSFGKHGFYTKLEKSYARDADYFLTVEMGGNLSHPEENIPITQTATT